MSEEEMALKLVIFEYEGRRRSIEDDTYLDRYFYNLEKIKSYNFENKKSKLENILKEYHSKDKISEFDIFNIIDEIEKILKE